MKVKILLLIASLLTVASAFAEEEGSHSEPSILDLKYSVLNFVLLVGFVVWKFKKPLSEMFDKKSNDVKTLMESAEKQAADAKAKLQELQGKIKNLDSELVKISTDYETDVVSFARLQSEESATTMARMKRDIENKIAGEKKELMDDLSHDLLNRVVGSAKNTIKSNGDLKSKATNNIIVGLK